MPRRARLSIAKIPWHIVQRGNNRLPCFFTTGNYSRYLELLASQSAKFNCAVHAYCLMTNHVHLLITPAHANSASLMMKSLSQRYVQHINKKYERTGTLWDGRYKSCLIQERRYLLACYRYIELNPVQAGMVTNPEDYPWSSYKFNAEGSSSSLITPHAEYLQLSNTKSKRLKEYKSLFENQTGSVPRVYIL